jgi:hypothetical protein
MTYCPLCGHDHDPAAPHMIFGTPITQAFGVDLSASDEAEPVPTADDVTALLADYQRLQAKEDKAREAKAADMRRYRANVRSRQKEAK